MANIGNMLNEVIEKEVRGLETIDEEAKSEAINNIVKLHKLRMEEMNAETERDKYRREFALREEEACSKASANLREEQAMSRKDHQACIDRYVNIGIAAAQLLIPLAFYGVWVKKGYRFEETGSYTSTTLKNLLGRLKPTK